MFLLRSGEMNSNTTNLGVVGSNRYVFCVFVLENRFRLRSVMECVVKIKMIMFDMYFD